MGQGDICKDNVIVAGIDATLVNLLCIYILKIGVEPTKS